MKKDNKKTLVSIFDSVAREGATLIPAGGIAYDTIKALVQRTLDYHKEQTQIKLELFFDKLSSDEQDDFLKKEFSMDDYHLLVKKLIQDDDRDKVEFYSNLMKGIIINEISTNRRKHYIKCLSELTLADLKVLTQIYIYNTFEISGVGNRFRQLKNIKESNDPLIPPSLGNLFRLGLVIERDDIYQPTELLNEFILLLHGTDKPTPSSIGEISVESADVFISNFVSTEDDLKRLYNSLERDDELPIKVSHYKNALSHIESMLDRLGISYVSSSPKNFHKIQEVVSMHIICIDHRWNSMHMAYWNRNVLNKNNTVKVVMTDPEDDHTSDYLDTTNILQSISLTSGNMRVGLQLLEERVLAIFEKN